MPNKFNLVFVFYPFDLWTRAVSNRLPLHCKWSVLPIELRARTSLTGATYLPKNQKSWPKVSFRYGFRFPNQQSSNHKKWPKIRFFMFWKFLICWSSDKSYDNRWVYACQPLFNSHAFCQIPRSVRIKTKKKRKIITQKLTCNNVWYYRSFKSIFNRQIKIKTSLSLSETPII